ncbi:SDR family oxidoreductase [Arenibaculum sp.]|jgi:NAD(P)-dependent dehydrogenase (short-subunit alcohol dehydrogenase family)|uniref:SDR family oxidoreductase n=1 Tax=Arenibaculum sp. TaxID=2865862 RepID=UPI002E15F325|nr:SDR family oxidoreductase [Arenibaculum sp.]
MTGTVIVTGGGRGIGAAAARLAAGRGHPVAVNYQGNAEAAEAVAAGIRAEGGHAVAIRADVSRQDEVAALFDRAVAELGPLSGLVNSAGVVGPYGRLDEVPAEELARVVEVNLMGTLLCCREAVRRLSTRHGGPGGAIVNLSSRASVLGSPNEFVTYAASKGAVDSLTLGLAREVASEGVRINAVRPGLIDTDIQEIPGFGNRLDTLRAAPPIGRPGTAEEVARTVVWLLSEEASYVTGALLDVSGGR